MKISILLLALISLTGCGNLGDEECHHHWSQWSTPTNYFNGWNVGSTQSRHCTNCNLVIYRTF